MGKSCTTTKNKPPIILTPPYRSSEDHRPSATDTAVSPDPNGGVYKHTLEQHCCNDFVPREGNWEEECGGTAVVLMLHAVKTSLSKHRHSLISRTYSRGFGYFLWGTSGDETR